MNIGLVACAIPIPLLIVVGIAFALFKGKAAILVSGFNTMFEHEREQYDADAIAKDMRNDCAIWSAILLAGCLASYFITPFAAIVAYAIWIALLLKGVRLYPTDAFEKYRW